MTCGACGGDGFVEHPPGSGALVPCEFCRKKAYDRWCEGKYGRPVRSTP